jgi:cell division protein FtsN
MPVLALAGGAAVLVAFAIGVLVGRGRSPEPLPTSEVVTSPDALTGPAAADQGPQIEMIRPDGTTAPVPAATVAPQPDGAAPAAPAPVEPPAPAPVPAPTAAPEPAPTAAPIAAPAAKPPVAGSASGKATPKPPVVKPGGGTFTVQVAAFRDRESAERLALQLESRGYDAYVQRSEVSGKGTWYRVRVGAFNDKEAARALAQKIERQEGRSAYITTR